MPMKRMMCRFFHRRATLIGAMTGIGFFVLWMRMVGNPHVVETVIGLVMAAYIVWAMRRYIINKTKDAIDPKTLAEDTVQEP